MSHPFIQQNKFFLAAIAAGLGVLVLTLSGRAGIARTWTLATTRQPQGYYELYFAQPNQLPREIFGSRASSVNYKITDHELSQSIEVVATQTVGSQTRILQTKQIFLTDKQTSSQSVSFVAPPSGTQYQIQIRILGTDQLIQFKGLSR